MHRQPMTPNEETIRFIRTHRTDDVRALALQARKHPEVDMPVALTQIAGWQIAREKVPTWAATEGILYPVHLSMEQCSSEVTARYKAEVVARLGCGSPDTLEHSPAETPGNTPSGTLTDLTGGFGIDCAFLSARFRHADYVERQEALCETAAHNFPLLGLSHIRVHHADSLHHLQAMPPADWIFIDPARRDSHGGKAVAISDCEPDVSALEDLLLAKARHVLVKLSPMLDLALALKDLKHVQEAHIVSVGNECKELLLVLNREAHSSAEDTPIHCTNLTGNGCTPLPAAPSPSPAPAALSAEPTALLHPLTFTRRQEREADCPFTSTLGAYLYEPNASVLKAGAFRTVAHIYKVKKLHPNSHLYTSDHFLPHFPGRRFRILSSCGFGKKEVARLLSGEKKANLTVRNFPSTVADLRRRLKLAEGGNTYLFATTLADESRVLIRCEAATL